MSPYPLILRLHRLIAAFTQSDTERDFYLDRREGCLLFADLEQGPQAIALLEQEMAKQPSRYCLIPKPTRYESKKFMEGFVSEKVYDFDVKEKLLDLISSKEGHENVLDFLRDAPHELEKWQQYHHERSRVRVIEWLRSLQIAFVFEEELELPTALIEKLKRQTTASRLSKEISNGRQAVITKANSYLSPEALHPRPKRGRPPKQAPKVEEQKVLSKDLFAKLPAPCRPFLYLPELEPKAPRRQETPATPSSKDESSKMSSKLEALSKRLHSLRLLSERLKGSTRS